MNNNILKYKVSTPIGNCISNRCPMHLRSDRHQQ